MAFEIDTHDDEFVMDDDFEDQTKIMVIGVGGGGFSSMSEKSISILYLRHVAGFVSRSTSRTLFGSAKHPLWTY